MSTTTRPVSRDEQLAHDLLADLRRRHGLMPRPLREYTEYLAGEAFDEYVRQPLDAERRPVHRLYFDDYLTWWREKELTRLPDGPDRRFAQALADPSLYEWNGSYAPSTPGYTGLWDHKWIARVVTEIARLAKALALELAHRANGSTDDVDRSDAYEAGTRSPVLDAALGIGTARQNHVAGAYYSGLTEQLISITGCIYDLLRNAFDDDDLRNADNIAWEWAQQPS